MIFNEKAVAATLVVASYYVEQGQGE